MGAVGSTTLTTLRVVALLCPLLVGAEIIQIVTPENTSTVTEEPATTTLVPDDSYLRAYQEAQKLRSAPAKRNDHYDPPEKETQGGYNTVVRSSHLPSDKYPSLTPEWVPMHPVSPPPHVYGPPQNAHPPHAHHHYHELLPPTHCHATPYSAPSNFYLGIIPKKLSLKILLKLILKLVLFKMIVKFIAVICLLLFIPLLKSKETSTQGDADEDRRAREIDSMSNMIWDSIEEKNSLYGEHEELKDIREIAEQVDEDDEDEEKNVFASPMKAVRFLEFCVSTVDRVVGFILGVLQRKKNEGEGEDLGSFVLKQLDSFFKSL